jgi:hypothetical protein
MLEPSQPQSCTGSSGEENTSSDGRYSVEFNVDGIAEGLPGDWTHFSAHETLIDAIRAASEFMELAKDALGVGRIEDRADDTIEPWIRIMDLHQAALVAWVDNGALQVHQEIQVNSHPG